MPPKFYLYLCGCAFALMSCVSGPQSVRQAPEPPPSAPAGQSARASAAEAPAPSADTPSAPEGTDPAQLPDPAATLRPTALQAGRAKDPAPKNNVNACELIKKSEIKSVQGVAVAERKSDERPSGPFIVSQCYYTATPFNKSVSLEVTRAGAKTPAGQGVEAFWQRRFREAKPSKGADVPQRVEGVGDEAYWAGNDLIGSLYVRKGDQIVRISVGGKDDPESKKKKSVALARKALGRL